ncbi:squalene/phytoene synthase family protein [Thalassospira marina]|uniref:Phytoene desaturase n=1 Tax=Thalassospira marina TaxID=2048283 RepID=A0ABM6Q567_9PROT|nr:squalene/phytoene synthase family protein [Thalassospira marina]AUG51654.1 phytoene desaturase [Thalassospira marina]
MTASPSPFYGSSEDPFFACKELAAAKNANLYRAAMRLNAARQRFFLAAYASMRVIDDIVDDGFLEKSDAERDSLRDETFDIIDRWQDQIEAAKVMADNPWPDVGPLPAAVYEALTLTLGESDLSVDPWVKLADALRKDVAEDPLDEWDDFIAYCEGATAAPASIFVYLLSARFDDEIGYVSALTASPLYHARDMAIFCYVVHILRDLPIDVKGPDRLVTIPGEILLAADISIGEIRNAIGQQNFDALNQLGAFMLEKAWEHFETGQARSAELLAILDPEETDTLSRLFGVYIELAALMDAGYGAFLADRAEIIKDTAQKSLPDLPGATATSKTGQGHAASHDDAADPVKDSGDSGPNTQ